MDNKENYKKAIDQIHASEDLKEKAFENAQFAKSNKYSALKLLSTCAAVLILCFVGINSMNKNVNPVETNLADKNKEEKIQEIVLANAELPRFESMEQLKEALNVNSNIYKGIYFDGVNEVLTESATEVKQSVTSSINSDNTTKSTTTESTISDLDADYSTTNTQVENVDEADIVKTDGEHIYYVLNGILYIVKADNLEIVSTIKIQSDNERFTISEIFLKDDKVVLLGNGYILEEPITKTTEEESMTDSVRVNTLQTAKAIVYNIENKNAPEKIREVALEGNYLDSRMVGDNLYLISRKYAYFYGEVEDYTILPVMKDSIATQEDVKRIDCTDIVYFEGTEDTSFMLVGGFNINDTEEAHVETFFGAGDTVYANEKNLYLTQTVYGNDYNYKTTIYKFALEEAMIKLLAKGEVAGKLNNQFSMDEYDGNLRLATTSYITVEPEKTEDIGNGNVMTTLATRTTTNNLYVLNENLEEIGKIEDLAKEEKIYSVRFIGKIGYIVTFKEVDPLFVIDLSDPTNPTVKGELKIPGYSSYLHPYDENHIIGIGYNTKDNGYGGITNSTMKMSMFDVSDLENPQEIFSVDIGTDYASSEVTYNHKALFYKKAENLIGFPVNYRSNNYRKNENGFINFKIDLENNQFEKYGEILQKMDYRSDVRRVIYIEDILYTLGYSGIVSYDLNTFEKLDEVELKEEGVYELLVD